MPVDNFQRMRAATTAAMKMAWRCPLWLWSTANTAEVKMVEDLKNMANGFKCICNVGVWPSAVAEAILSDKFVSQIVEMCTKNV